MNKAFLLCAIAVTASLFAPSLRAQQQCDTADRPSCVDDNSVVFCNSANQFEIRTCAELGSPNAQCGLVPCSGFRSSDCETQPIFGCVAVEGEPCLGAAKIFYSQDSVFEQHHLGLVSCAEGLACLGEGDFVRGFTDVCGPPPSDLEISECQPRLDDATDPTGCYGPIRDETFSTTKYETWCAEGVRDGSFANPTGVLTPFVMDCSSMGSVMGCSEGSIGEPTCEPLCFPPFGVCDPSTNIAYNCPRNSVITGLEYNARFCGDGECVQPDQEAVCVAGPPDPGGEGEGEPPADCTNTCQFAGDDECDDGRPGAASDLCGVGTDCFDCDGQVLECSNTCQFARDGVCDDARGDAAVCDLGTDCDDCDGTPTPPPPNEGEGEGGPAPTEGEGENPIDDDNEDPPRDDDDRGSDDQAGASSGCGAAPTAATSGLAGLVAVLAAVKRRRRSS